MRGILAFALSLALTLFLAACTPTQEDVPEDIGAPAVTEPADTSALERDFGFKPSTSLRDGLRKFAEWYREFYMK